MKLLNLKKKRRNPQEPHVNNEHKILIPLIANEGQIETSFSVELCIQCVG